MKFVDMNGNALAVCDIDKLVIYGGGRKLYEIERDSFKPCELRPNRLGDVFSMQTDEEKNYLHACKLTFLHPVQLRRFHVEKIPCGDDWRLPEGAKWGSGYGDEEHPQFDTYDNSAVVGRAGRFKGREGFEPAEKGVIKRWFTVETAEDFSAICTERYYTKTEYSPERVRKNELADLLNKCGISNCTFSHYDIDKLEQFVTLTPKKQEGQNNV